MLRSRQAEHMLSPGNHRIFLDRQKWQLFRSACVCIPGVPLCAAGTCELGGEGIDIVVCDLAIKMERKNAVVRYGKMDVPKFGFAVP